MNPTLRDEAFSYGLRCSAPKLLLAAVIGVVLFYNAEGANAGVGLPELDSGALAGDRPRVVVSTDIGGTDPDDFQSMMHLLLYTDSLDLEGLISSPFGPGRQGDILKVIDAYAKDFPNLRTYSDRYPSPESLKTITKQGETEIAPYRGYRRSTEGSDWIIQCARREDPRPLHILVWGLIEDLSQALHDAPDILPKLRVYWIGGPNKKWGPNAYQYLVDHHPDLWIIETNAAYRGWFNGGNQNDDWSNTGFPRRHIDGHGALGEFFMTQLGGRIKMGDTPSVAWLLKGDSSDPSSAGWGGQFVRAWKRPYARFERMPKTTEEMEVFGVLELALPLGGVASERLKASLSVENQSIAGHVPGDGTIRFRFSPKAAKTFRFEIQSDEPALNGLKGGITAIDPPVNLTGRPDKGYSNWWTDHPAPEYFEGAHMGAKTINQWREDYLSDFARRMDRLLSPNNPINQ